MTKYERCVRKVKKKIKEGKIPKTYRADGIKKTSPYAICSRLRASKKEKTTIDKVIKDTLFSPRTGIWMVAVGKKGRVFKAKKPSTLFKQIRKAGLL